MAGLVACSALMAQEAEGSQDIIRKAKNGLIEGVEVSRFSSFYHANNTLYSWSLEISPLNGQVLAIHRYPVCTMSQVGVLVADKKNRKSIYSFDSTTPRQLKLNTQPMAFEYSHDGRNLVVATRDSSIIVYDAIRLLTKGKAEPVRQFKIPFLTDQINISQNLYFLAAKNGKNLHIWNYETGRERKVLSFDAKVNDYHFSPDNTMLAVVTANGELTTFDTRDFKVIKNYKDLGEALSCRLHEDGKYVAVQENDVKITLLNLKNEADKTELTSDVAIVGLPGFVETHDGVTNLTYANMAANVIHPCDGLIPNRQRLVSDQVNSRLAEWSKQQAGESNEAYRARMTEENRMAQARLFENEVATDLAGSLLDDSEVSFGNYSPESNMLTVNFSNLPSIFLEVPEEDVAAFKNTDDLTFMNTVYGLTDNDDFEMIYTEVLNGANGKTYVFDNKERRSLDFMSLKDDFVSIEVLQMASADQLKLEEIKEEVIAEAKDESLISDHTNIQVNANPVSATDADGRSILNYQVKYVYDVDMEYSSKDDFGPGKYNIKDSQAALAMLAIIKKAFEGDLKQYVQPGKKLQVKVTGTADATPIVRTHIYQGEYGNFDNELMYNKGELSTITLSKGGKIVKNEELAFLRAQGVKNYVVENIPAFSEMNATYDTHIEVAEGSGSQFRRIGIEFTFIDAFKK